MESLRKTIKETISGWPNRELAPGVMVDMVGYKYVTFISCRNTGRDSRMTLDEFYHCFILKDKELNEDSYIKS